MIARNHIRAARYRALALAEKDQARANLLDRLAEEAEHGVLCTVRHLRLVHSAETAPPAPSLDAQVLEAVSFSQAGLPALVIAGP